jgi:hypothetical protein
MLMLMQMQCNYGAKHRRCYNHCLQTNQNEIRVTSGASIMTSEPMVCLAQIVHLSSIKIVSISERNEIRFYMTHVT